MSSLETCTDRLLRHKAVQGSHYARVEEQLLQLQRTHRAACVKLQLLLDAVQRRARDCRDLREGSAQLTQQLTQSRLRLHALQLVSHEAVVTTTTTTPQPQQQTTTTTTTTTLTTTGAAAVRGELDSCRDVWAGHAPRIVQLVRALQARRVCMTAAQTLTQTLQRTNTLVHLVLQYRDVAAAQRRVRAAQRTACGRLRRLVEEQQRRLMQQCAPRVQRAMAATMATLRALHAQTTAAVCATCALNATQAKWLQWHDELRCRSAAARVLFAVTRDALDHLIADDEGDDAHNDTHSKSSSSSSSSSWCGGMRVVRAEHAAATVALAQLRERVAAAHASRRAADETCSAAVAALAAQEDALRARCAAAHACAARDAAAVRLLVTRRDVYATAEVRDADKAADEASAAAAAATTTQIMSLPLLLDALHAWQWLVTVRARVRDCARRRCAQAAAAAAAAHAAWLTQLRDAVAALCAEQSLTRRSMCADEAHAWDALCAQWSCAYAEAVAASRQRRAAAAAAAAAVVAATPLRVCAPRLRSAHKRARATSHALASVDSDGDRVTHAAAHDCGDSSCSSSCSSGANTTVAAVAALRPRHTHAIGVLHDSTPPSPSPLPRRPVVAAAVVAASSSCATAATRTTAAAAPLHALRAKRQPLPQPPQPQHNDDTRKAMTRAPRPLPAPAQRLHTSTTAAATVVSNCGTSKRAQQQRQPLRSVRVHNSKDNNNNNAAAAADEGDVVYAEVLGGQLYSPSPSPRATVVTRRQATAATTTRATTRRVRPAAGGSATTAMRGRHDEHWSTRQQQQQQQRLQRSPVHAAATAAVAAAAAAAPATTSSSQASEDIFADMYV